MSAANHPTPSALTPQGLVPALSGAVFHRFFAKPGALAPLAALVRRPAS
jgi:hypothetical protein